MLLPQKIAFVDIETTGARPTYDRVLEIGIVRVENNKVVKEYRSLFNPHTHISPFIEQLTGIRQQDVEHAPNFWDEKEAIMEMLSDCVFVAHNVRFDYGFLRNEMKRHGVSFSSKHFCTVKLSRLLYPQFSKHDLDSLIDRFSIPCSNRHRAFDDANVLWEFYKRLQSEVPHEKLSSFISVAMKRPSRPLNISEDELDALPESPGVYIFYGSEPSGAEVRSLAKPKASDKGGKEPSGAEVRSLAKPKASDKGGSDSGKARGDRLHSSEQSEELDRGGKEPSTKPNLIPLYIGKSINIRERVLSHFSNDSLSGVDMQLSQEIHHIECLPTGGELSALFKESTLVKQMQPLYNRKLRLSRKLTVLKKYTDPGGFDSVLIDTMDAITVDDLPFILGIVRSKKQAKTLLTSLAKDYGLCHKLLGIEKTTTACFLHRLGWCKGACISKEQPVAYNVRFLTAFTKHRIKPWPFEGPIIIREENSFDEIDEAFIVDKWCVVGSYRNNSTQEDPVPVSDYIFDLDTYKILVSFFRSPKNFKKISSQLASFNILSPNSIT